MARSRTAFDTPVPNPGLLLLVMLGIWGQGQSANAHGASIQAREAIVVEIQATYDSGEPMAEASVVIYNPSDPQNPQFEGTTDSEGRFTFTPDQPGDWEVTVRQAGHGAITVVPVSSDNTITATVQAHAPLTALQRGVMAAAVTWGCIGTALYFWRGKR